MIETRQAVYVNVCRSFNTGRSLYAYALPQFLLLRINRFEYAKLRFQPFVARVSMWHPANMGLESMSDTTLRFTSFPRTEQPPFFIKEVMNVFAKHETGIATENVQNSLNSSAVLNCLQPDLMNLGFQIEKGNQTDDRIDRPVFFGEDGKPSLMYRVDAYHDRWRCGLEVEASRGWLSNAIYRDLIQAAVMVDVDHLIVAVVNKYVYKVSGKQRTSPDYRNVVQLANALYGHSRMPLPYGLTVIGY